MRKCESMRCRSFYGNMSFEIRNFERIHTDNDPQFASQAIRDFYSSHNIKLTFSTPMYPQAIDKPKASNKAIIDTLKKRLKVVKG